MFSAWHSAADSPHKCWGCSVAIDEQNGISLNDNVVTGPKGDQLDVHVCRKCWDKVPVQHRIWIRLLSLGKSRGGIGAPEFLETFKNLLASSLKCYRSGEKFDDMQGGEGRWN